MGQRQYRVEAITTLRHSTKRRSRRRARARLKRLEDGRVFEVTMVGLPEAGNVVSLDDDHVSIALWQPPLEGEPGPADSAGPPSLP